jgi:hypothetical protein
MQAEKRRILVAVRRIEQKASSSGRKEQRVSSNGRKERAAAALKSRRRVIPGRI